MLCQNAIWGKRGCLVTLRCKRSGPAACLGEETLPCLCAEAASYSKILKILRAIKTTEDATPEDATASIYMLCDLGAAVARHIYLERCGGNASEVTRISGGCCLPKPLFRARSKNAPGWIPCRDDTPGRVPVVEGCWFRQCTGVEGRQEGTGRSWCSVLQLQGCTRSGCVSSALGVLWDWVYRGCWKAACRHAENPWRAVGWEWACAVGEF